MSKKIALSVLFSLCLSLALVVPAAARPPLCTCPLCAVGNASCSLPDGSITTCGPYFGSHCTGPNLAPSVPAMATLAALTAPSCTAGSPVFAVLFPPSVMPASAQR
ncbi:MAG TPA: hypothetical protein VFE33_23365 [Thermoanaerobaculia bacterium]|nr:hypothetical protein [Thermoanaerobaculia bacterium]